MRVDDSLVKQLEKNGINVKDNQKQDCFIINSGSFPQLFINDSEENYLIDDNGEIHIILIEKANGNIVDNVCFKFDKKENVWVRANKENAETSKDEN